MSEADIEKRIQDKGLNAPRLTPDLIDDAIIRAEYHVFQGKHTVCCLTLKNGYTVLGESACVSPANYNLEIGRDVAYENARLKVWPLEGYLLQQRNHDGQ